MNSETAPLKPIFENERLIAFNKPSGLHSVKNSRSKNCSMAELIEQEYPQYAESSERPEDCGLVNRLDQETSGVVLVAKNRESWREIHEALGSSKAQKTYLAAIEGKPKTPLTIDAFIGSPYRRGTKVRVSEKKFARSLAALSEIVSVSPLSADASLAQIEAKSGRRHQIRAHCSFASCPLVGDSLYGSKIKLESVFKGEHLPKFFLHAWKVRLLMGREILIKAPLPDFANCLPDF